MYPLLVKAVYIVTNTHLEEVYRKFVVSFLSSSARKKVRMRNSLNEVCLCIAIICVFGCAFVLPLV